MYSDKVKELFEQPTPQQVKKTRQGSGNKVFTYTSRQAVTAVLEQGAQIDGVNWEDDYVVNDSSVVCTITFGDQERSATAGFATPDELMKRVLALEKLVHLVEQKDKDYYQGRLISALKNIAIYDRHLEVGKAEAHAFKRAASHFGIFADLWPDEDTPVPQSQRQAQQPKQTATRQPQAQASTVPTSGSNGHGSLSDPQYRLLTQPVNATYPANGLGVPADLAVTLDNTERRQTAWTDTSRFQTSTEASDVIAYLKAALKEDRDGYNPQREFALAVASIRGDGALGEHGEFADEDLD